MSDFGDHREEQFLLVSFTFIDELANIKGCDNCNEVKREWKIVKRHGLANEIVITCKICKNEVFKKFTSEQKTISEPLTGKMHMHHQVNTRMVFAAHKTQSHYAKMVDFLCISGLPGAMSKKTYQNILELIFDGSKKAVLENLADARDLVKAKLCPGKTIMDTPVSFDGSWHKRGHTSHYGISFCIEPVTRVILDYMVVSNYCKLCSIMQKKLDKEEFENWKIIHASQCDKNYGGSGSSNAMEKYMAEELWKRSENNGFRYTTLIGDGDAKVHAALCSLHIYGDEPIVKQECINHVGKKMRTNMNTVVSEERVKKHTMGGKGRLTDDRRARWGSYFRNAIVNADGDAEKASKAVWAILYHNCHTDEKNMHEYCDISWCFYLQARERGEEGPVKWWSKHVNSKPLTQKAFEALKPRFHKLSDVDFLKKCMDLYTQNANESLHSTIWSRCCKANFVGRKYLESVVADRVSDWNKGAKAILAQGYTLAIPMSPTVIHISSKKNKARIKNAASAPETVASRKRQRRTETILRKRQEEVEGVTYQAGAF